jgi:hypothetical protein
MTETQKQPNLISAYKGTLQFNPTSNLTGMRWDDVNSDLMQSVGYSCGGGWGLLQVHCSSRIIVREVENNTKKPPEDSLPNKLQVDWIKPLPQMQRGA